MTESRKGMLVVVSGPSGAGKGTLCDKLLRDDPSLIFSVSVTTRPRREYEIEGVHYYFLPDDEYDRLVEEDAFIEHATFSGHRYGTLKSEVDRRIEEGKNVLLDIDQQGAQSVMRIRPDCVSIFILPPSYESLRVRLHTRNTDDEREIERRLGIAREDIRQMPKYQYVVVNDDLELAYEQISHIIAAEKQRTSRYFPVVE